MAHDRKFVVGGVALVKARLKGTGPAMVAICDELEPILVQSGFIGQAPFRSVNLIIRYGLKDSFIPEYQKINKKYGDLPIAIEVDVSDLVGADVEKVRTRFRAASIEALVHVGRKFALPIESLLAARDLAARSVQPPGPE